MNPNYSNADKYPPTPLITAYHGNAVIDRAGKPIMAGDIVLARGVDMCRCGNSFLAEGCVYVNDQPAVCYVYPINLTDGSALRLAGKPFGSRIFDADGYLVFSTDCFPASRHWLARDASSDPTPGAQGGPNA